MIKLAVDDGKLKRPISTINKFPSTTYCNSEHHAAYNEYITKYLTL